MDRAEQKSLIESLLFISGNPLTLSELKKITGLQEEEEVINSINNLANEYREKNRGMLIIEVAGGYQMVSNPSYSDWVKVLKKSGSESKLSMPSLETLSLIAYNQPVTKAEIEHVRSVNSEGPLKTLLEKRLIKILGRKEAPGKPLLYGTTTEFLQYFGLKDLTELPTLKELLKEE